MRREKGEREKNWKKKCVVAQQSNIVARVAIDRWSLDQATQPKMHFASIDSSSLDRLSSFENWLIVNVNIITRFVMKLNEPIDVLSDVRHIEWIESSIGSIGSITGMKVGKFHH